MSEPSVKYIRFRDFSGCKIDGTADVPLPDSDFHMDRAYYLTAMLEAPKYGSVQSYDGAAMSGGPLHNIAVYPRNLKAQGSLFPLLRAIEKGLDNENLYSLWWALRDDANWYIARDGKLRHYETGRVISGTEIRNEFSPPNGRVPRTGPNWEKAKKWAILFHKLFADPATFKAQKEFAIDYLISTRSRDQERFYGELDINNIRVSEDKCDSDFLCLEEDLALSVYHSHSVNGPAPAATVLRQVIQRHAPISRGPAFAKDLIWTLGNRAFGRWKYTEDGRNRYSRTRIMALRSGLWPREFFVGNNSLMPLRLPSR
jgi:hypothetical protein